MHSMNIGENFLFRSLPGEQPHQWHTPARWRCPVTVLAYSRSQLPGEPRLCGHFCAGRITQTHILRQTLMWQRLFFFFFA